MSEQSDSIAAAMQAAWDDFIADAGCIPDCFTINGDGTVSADFGKGNFARMVANWFKPPPVHIVAVHGRHEDNDTPLLSVVAYTDEADAELRAAEYQALCDDGMLAYENCFAAAVPVRTHYKSLSELRPDEITMHFHDDGTFKVVKP